MVSPAARLIIETGTCSKRSLCLRASRMISLALKRSSRRLSL